MSRASSIIVRSTSSTALGPSSTICRVAVHRAVEAREMADAEDPVRRDRLQFELDLGEEGEGAFGADQQVRHVVAAHRRSMSML